MFWSQVPTKHGEERVCFFFVGQIRGGERLLPIFSAKHGGQMGDVWASNMLSPVFLLRGGFWAISGGSSRAGTEKKEAEEEEEEEEEEKKRSRRRRGRRMTKEEEE